MDSKQVRGMMEAYASIYEKKGDCVDKKDKGMHNCAKKVCHEEYGEGETIFGQHAVPDENGFVSHYNVQFEHGIVENVSVEELEIITEGSHNEENHQYEGEMIDEAEVDVFDVIKGHLMSEGYADTEEAAIVIMANMSEEWRQSIVEQGGAHYGLVGVPKRPYDVIPGVRKLRTAISNRLHSIDYPGADGDLKSVKVGDKVVPYDYINPGAYNGLISIGRKPARRVTDLESGESKSSRQIGREMTREEVDSQGNRSHDLFTGKPNPNYKPGNAKPKPQVKKEPPMRDEPLW